MKFDRAEFLKQMQAFALINQLRGNRFHTGGMEEWSIFEWAGAAAGEAGECANAAKKLRRMELSPHGSKNNFMSRDDAIRAIAQEAAGTLVYLDLLATRAGFSLGQALIDEFNRVSEREGYPEKL